MHCLVQKTPLFIILQKVHLVFLPQRLRATEEMNLVGFSRSSCQRSRSQCPPLRLKAINQWTSVRHLYYYGGHYLELQVGWALIGSKELGVETESKTRF